MAKVLLDSFGIERGFMTTIHAYTNDQKILDFPHKDLRRARGGGAVHHPDDDRRRARRRRGDPGAQGQARRLRPARAGADGSVVDLVVELGREVTAEEVNAAMRRRPPRAPMKGILQYCEDPIVSIDVIGNSHSSIFDAALTMANGTLVKVVSWYDNEWGYSCRLVDLVTKVV